MTTWTFTDTVGTSGTFTIDTRADEPVSEQIAAHFGEVPVGVDDLIVDLAVEITTATHPQIDGLLTGLGLALVLDVSPPCADGTHTGCDGRGLDPTTGTTGTTGAACPCACHTP